MPQMSIYVTTELQKKMNSASSEYNWSKLAAKAFEENLLTPMEFLENEFNQLKPLYLSTSSKTREIIRSLLVMSRIET